MALHNPGEYAVSMKYYIVNEDQLLDLVYKIDVNARFLITVEIKKNEIQPAHGPVRSPRIFTPALEQKLYICPGAPNCEDNCSHGPVHLHNINCNFTKGTCHKCIPFDPQPGE